MNCAIYARYSTDLQNQASIEDQLRLCRERAAGEGWPILECYTDAAISGASLMRPGIQQLMQDAMAGGSRSFSPRLSTGFPATSPTSPGSISA
jgi:DNA invertase Pin-like site-specific DNA recombinase